VVRDFSRETWGVGIVAAGGCLLTPGRGAGWSREGRAPEEFVMSASTTASQADRREGSTSTSTPEPVQASSTTYEGYRHLRKAKVRRQPDNAPLRIGPSRSLATHSRGFEWGYAGSGPAQLSLALLLDYYGDEELALECYQRFCTKVVSELEGRWTLSGHEIEEAVAEILEVLADE